MLLGASPLRTAEFLVVDVETNGCSGEECELTEVGAVLVGGGELHERFHSLVAVGEPLSPGIQRFTGITEAMVAAAPPPEEVLRAVAARLEGRVLVAHSAAFDRRVLRQAFGRAGLPWPEPPSLCTVSMARRFAPLVRQRRLGLLAAALEIPVETAHRALPDAETCARVFCALFPRLCAHAGTVGEAVAVCSAGAGRRRRPRPGRVRRPPAARGAPAPGRTPAGLESLPDEPGVYVFRDAAGRPLYIGKSVALRSRARAHFAPGADRAGWTAQAEVVDHRTTRSELGALLLENRLIKRERPPGNRALKRTDRLAYLRCRLDIAFPILEVAGEPAAGLAVNVGPFRGRAAAGELVEQLNSLWELRHCGRRLPRREHPSAYGQMGRCLSPCLGDLDPNLYRRRLDEALMVFTRAGDGGRRLLEELDRRMGEAAAARRYERAAVLHRRRRRIEQLLDRIGGAMRAAHAHPRIVVAGHPRRREWDVLWLVGGRVVDSGPLPGPDDLVARTRTALERGRDTGPGPGAVLTPAEAAELRIVSGWLARHEEAPVLPIDETPERGRVEDFLRALRS